MERALAIAHLLRNTAHALLGLRRDAFRGAGRRRAMSLCSSTVHEMRRIALRDTGTMVVSHPKSGRTWLRVMLDSLGIHLRYDHHQGPLVVPRACEGKQLLFLHRDPRDTALSYWFELTRRRPIVAMSLSQMLRDPAFGLEPIVEYNLFWNAAVRGSGRGLVTTYEALRGDTEAELGRIVLFVNGATCSPAALRSAVAAGAFDRMRALEASGRGAALYGRPLDPHDPRDTDTYKTRRGIVGGWRDAFSASDVAYAEALLEQRDYFSLMQS
jgi:hypothetical protein